MFGKVLRKQESYKQMSTKQQKKEEKFNKKQNKNEERLKGSQFRLLNEYLYTVNSEEAQKHFKINPQEFKIYHNGYASQIEKWPESPVKNIIKLIQDSDEFNKAQLQICDLGCGQGEIQHFFETNLINGRKVIVKSFDLVALKPYIIEADISHVPLQDQSCDIAIFSLSLMGKNYLDYLGEAFRMLKLNGHLIIAEVKSRMNTIDTFVKLITGMGFKIQKRDEHNSHFVLFVFKKINEQCLFNGILTQKRVLQILGHKDNNFKDWQSLGQHILQPCLYKKR